MNYPVLTKMFYCNDRRSVFNIVLLMQLATERPSLNSICETQV